MNFLELLNKFVEARNTFKLTILSGQRHGTSDTILEHFEPEDLRPLILRSEEILRPGRPHTKSDFQALWKSVFRTPLSSYPKRRGNKPIEVHEGQMELLTILASVLGADLLTSQMENDEIRGMVLGSFQEQQYRYERDALYGLSYKGDTRVVFYRKALKVVLNLYGNLESLTPLIAFELPSDVAKISPVITIDSILDSLNSASKNASEILSYQMMLLLLRCGQILRMQEFTDDEILARGPSSLDEYFSPEDGDTEDQE